MGGLSRKAHVLKNSTQEDILPFLLLDSGNSLYPSKIKNDKLTNQQIITGSAITSIYALMNYDAVNVSYNDLKGGFDILTQASSVPWLSANFYTKENKPLFSTQKIKRINDVTVGIIGITSPPQTNKPVKTDYIFKDWEIVLPQIIESLEKKCDFIILLSTLPLAKNIKITELYPSIRLMITADSYRGRIHPKLFNNCVITQTEQKGKSLGFLSITNPKAPKWKEDTSKKRKFYEEKIKQHTTRITALQDREQELTKRESSHLKKMIQKRKIFQEKLKQLGPVQENNAELINFKSIFHLLKKSLPKDPVIEKIVQDTIAKINETNRKIALEKKKAVADKNQLIQATLPFSGSQKCLECHESHHKFWKETQHSHAFETLQKVKQDQNLECITCHITRPMGSFNLTEKYLPIPDYLKGVGCESCHGSGIAHTQDPTPNNIKKVVNESVCLACHTEERDDNFDFNKKKSLIKCPTE